MNLEKVIFGFFIVLALTLNVAFVTVREVLVLFQAFALPLPIPG